MESITEPVGVDVSKASLAISIAGRKAFEVPNTESGLESLMLRLPVGASIHLEASGGYERLAKRLLGKAGFTVRVHNPLRVRRYAQATGVRAKTDPLDAKSLASAGPVLKGSLVKGEEREALADISRAVETIKRERSDFKRRLGAAQLESAVVKAYEKVIASLDQQAKELELLFVERVKQSSLANDYKNLLSVPGMGVCAARVLLCELPADFKDRKASQIASYAGTAPFDDSSGKRKGEKHIRKGNVRIKAGLYMGAVSLIQSAPWAKELYAGLRAKGKDHQSAVVALIRRLILRCLAVLKRGTPWQEVPPKP